MKEERNKWDEKERCNEKEFEIVRIWERSCLKQNEEDKMKGNKWKAQRAQIEGHT